MAQQISPDLPTYLKQGEAARLIPSVAESSKERRSTSTLLAVLGSVEPFGQAMLRLVGAPVTTRSKVRCYTEVVFNGAPEDPKLRPDGLIVVEHGAKNWSAIVEAKVGGADLEADQVRSYVDIAKDRGMDAVITISNQFAALPTHHPVLVDKRKMRSVGLYHWSWMSVMSEAQLLADHGEVAHPGRAFILNELIRYLQHPGSGVIAGFRMGKAWREICDNIQSDARLGKSDDSVARATGDWHQLLRYLSLRLGLMVGRNVHVQMGRKHADDPAQRLQDDIVQLLAHHKLEAEFNIPDAAARLKFTADLRRRTLTAGMRLCAPTDKSRPTACVTWLVNQLAKCDRSDLLIRADWPGRTAATQATLGALRDDRKSILGPNHGLLPVGFEVCDVNDLAGKMKGAVNFVDESEATLKAFYGGVGQYLKAWVPPAPKVAKPVVGETGGLGESPGVGEMVAEPPRPMVA